MVTPCGVLLAQQVHDHLRIDRVEAAEGFVHDQQFRLVQQGGDHLGLLLHAFAEFLHFLVLVGSQVEAFQVGHPSAASHPPGCMPFSEPR